MNILHIISSLEIGGAQRLLSDILPLMAKGHAVTLLVNKKVDNDFSFKIKEAGVKIINCGCQKLHSPINVLKIAKLAKGYDVVHVHLFPTVYWAALASFLVPMNLVYTEHSTSNRRRGKWYFQPIERFIYSRYKKIISISQETQDALIGWLKSEKEDSRFVVINNGVNLSAFSHLKSEKMYPHTLIMVSRFADSKDQMTVIKAMTLLTEDVHVIFVGDGKNMDACKIYAREQGVSQRVHFVGRQSDVASWIARADIGVQSSNWEGFGLTAVELMAARKPVVATNVDGLKQVVEGAGLLFDIGDYVTLAELINRLLHDESLYEKTAEQCQERAKQYDVVTMMGKYMDIYKSIM